MPHSRHGGKNNGDGKHAGKRGDNITRVHDTYSPQNSFSPAPAIPPLLSVRIKQDTISERG
jgi:hypothetical protein